MLSVTTSIPIHLLSACRYHTKPQRLSICNLLRPLDQQTPIVSLDTLRIRSKSCQPPSPMLPPAITDNCVDRTPVLREERKTYDYLFTQRSLLYTRTSLMRRLKSGTLSQVQVWLCQCGGGMSCASYLVFLMEFSIDSYSSLRSRLPRGVSLRPHSSIPLF
jgi:hypothetical protein